MKRIKQKGMNCYLATDQEKYRGNYIKKNLGLENNLDGFFYSCELGFSKSEKEFFETILKKLDLKPGEVMFLDDEKENVEVAEKLGIKAVYIKEPADIMNLKI